MCSLPAIYTIVFTKLYNSLYPSIISFHPPNIWLQPLGKGSAVIKTHWFTCGETASTQSGLNTNIADWRGICDAVMAACGAQCYPHQHINTTYCSFERQIVAWDRSLLWLAFLHNNPGFMGGSGGNWESRGVRCRREEDREIGKKRMMPRWRAKRALAYEKGRKMRTV